MPVGSWFVAEAVLIDVIVEITHDDFIGDVPGGG